MDKLTIKPLIQKQGNKWQSKAYIYEKGFNYPIAVEFFDTYTDENTAWIQAKDQAQDYINNHNKGCKCSKKMVIGTY